MLARILAADKDIRMSLFFLTNLATILLYMQVKVARKGRSSDDFDIEFFKKKMSMYEVVFEAITEQFNNDMFGPYANAVQRESF